jgi:hypothetical protein
VRNMDQSHDSTEILPVIREELGFAWHTVRCALYISWWRLKQYVLSDPKPRKVAKIGAAISGMVLFLDLVLFFLHKEIALWLGGLAVFVLIPAGIVLAFHRVEEAIKMERESFFAQRVTRFVDAFHEINKASPENKQAALDNFVSDVLEQISADFADRLPTNVNLMFPSDDGKLRIVYLFPAGTNYDPNICFDPGEGGAGYSYKEAKAVYVPSIKYMHGIIIKLPSDAEKQEITYGLKPRLYRAISPEYEVYESILTLPVTSPMGSHAVLNIDSKRSDAFNMRDIHMLTAYSRMLGDGISMCPKDK